MSDKNYIISNQVECLKCGDAPFSMTRHDFRSCTCGHITVDGGQAYLKRLGPRDDYKELSINANREELEPVIQEVARSIRANRNALGITLACIRAIRDAELTPVRHPRGATTWMKESDVPTLVLEAQGDKYSPTISEPLAAYIAQLEERITKLQTTVDKVKQVLVV